MDWLRSWLIPTIAGLVFVGVAIHEWSYRKGHPHQLGPSGEILALAIAGAVLAFGVAAQRFEQERDEERRTQELFRRMYEARVAGGDDEIGDDDE